LRSSTSDGYLTTGIAYAFHAHRDTWYSAPHCQVNWWLPVFPIREDNCMAFHPHHWSNPLANSSSGYNYQRWNAESRFVAAQQIGVDTRVQPKPLEHPQLDPALRLLPPPGGMIVFSAAQLHSSVPNTSGRTRYSIDFRTLHSGDAASFAGAPNLDSHCTGTAMPDFLKVSDLTHVPAELTARYMGPHPQPPRA
jgi:ectoine hydroxylase-related dioxygenase (phytanoyl-CoA dioxygenase family)